MDEYSPRTAMPTVLVLKPGLWAPITGRSTPPMRPSKTVPHLSTRKLYAMSFQPLDLMWYVRMARTNAAESAQE